MARDTADLVVVGAGTVGGWASWFAATSGADRVVVVERGLAGQGASSRAAGVVRAQGGTPDTVRLGRYSISFYRRLPDLVGTDAGFRELGYLILATTRADEAAARERIAMQRTAGLDVRWVDADEARGLNPTLADSGYRGGSYASTDGCIDPPRNVRAYSLAMQRAGVDLRERTTFLGLRTAAGRGRRRRVTGVQTSHGIVATERVILTGGPALRDVGRLVGARIWIGGARHQVAVTESHPAFDVDRQPMVFDLRAGVYWRLEEGGLLFGMSNPTEVPGPALRIDEAYLRRMRRRLDRLVPVARGLGTRKVWAATIEYVSDHLPIVGPLLLADGSPVEGAFVAAAVGHGMMWGPGVSRIVADLALSGRTEVCDVSTWGMDRFDDHGLSPYHDPVALPFPTSAEDDDETSAVSPAAGSGR
jgi:sarcosine oxidase subunit beta